MPKLTPEQESELAELHGRSVTILDACARAEPGAWSEGLRAVVEQTAAKRSLRGMREVYRDLRGMTAGLPSSARRELAGELRRQFGPDVLAERDAAVVAKVRGRGHIRSEHEYRVVSAYADALGSEPAEQAEYLALGALLDAFSAGA